MDMWELWEAGAWVVVPTNRQTTRAGTAVMGAGVARDAALHCPTLPAWYGQHLTLGGDGFVAYRTLRIVCAPTKEHWKDPSTLELIEEAVTRLTGWQIRSSARRIAVPALGCGHGNLTWTQVQPILDRLPQPPFELIPPR